jgi:hypothetical protein
MATAEATTPKPRRGRFAVSVRTLMLLVLLACLALGWRVNRAQTQRRAVARIKAAGGSVKYDYEVGGEYPPKWAVRTKGEPVPWGPAWLRKWIGDEYFQEVTIVSLGGDRVTDDSLSAVEDLDRVIQLNLWNTRNVTNAGLTHLRGAKSVRSAMIHPRMMADAWLPHLAYLAELRELDLSRTPVTDSGLKHIERSLLLEALRLQGAWRVTDSGLACIKGLKNLRTLDLSGTMVTDAGLAHLENLAELRELDLSVDMISDAGITHLKGLHKLRELKLIGTSVTDGAVASLTVAIPKLVVSRQMPGFPGSMAVPMSARVQAWMTGQKSKD